MPQTLVCPEFLFLAGTVQALLPYVLWRLWGPNTAYDVRITGLPVVIYVAGYACFLAGTRLVNRPRGQPQILLSEVIHPVRLRWSTLCLSALGLLQAASIVRTYGHLPLIAFATGALDILEANELLDETWIGQLALLQLTLCCLTMTALAEILMALHRTNGRLLSLPVVLPLATVAIAFTAGGKRQGLIMSIVSLVTGLAIHSPDCFKRILDRLHARSTFARFLTYAGIGVAVLIFFESIGTLRTGQGERGDFGEAVRYLELPLINLEYQCELAGFGPGDSCPRALCRNLLPRRAQLILPDSFVNFRPPPRLEPTSPTGFYGELHWYSGVVGVILFAFFAGWLSKLCYVNASRSPFLFFCYCQLAWPLVACHTYNHFLNLLYVPVPVFLCRVLASWLCVQELPRSRHGAILGFPQRLPGSAICSRLARGATPGITGRRRSRAA